MLKGSFHVSFSARIAMFAMLLFTAIGHFVFTKGMALMFPNFIPQKELIVYLTGIFEVAAVGLLIPSAKNFTGWLLIAFFILILPANNFES